MEHKKYLPLGSVVLLQDATKRVMIYGRKQLNANDGQEFDYVGCFYPEGNVGPQFTFLFQHDQIETVHFLGLADDEEERAFQEKLTELDKADNIT